VKRASGLREGLRNNSLSLVFLLLCVVTIFGQAVSGAAQYNNDVVTEGLQQISVWQYMTSSDFAVDVAENWQSEYLQFLLFILLTVWLLQRGSPESKELEKLGRESDEEQQVAEYSTDSSPAWARVRGWRLSLYSRSLGLAMALIFLVSWLAQSIAGRASFNEQQLRQLQEPLSWLGYVRSADFWNRTLQNWQSEFLAVGSMAIIGVYLRERGSPESKPVGAPHDQTGVQG
jgi:flagellar biogenesis protein FliO